MMVAVCGLLRTTAWRDHVVVDRIIVSSCVVAARLYGWATLCVPELG